MERTRALIISAFMAIIVARVFAAPLSTVIIKAEADSSDFNIVSIYWGSPNTPLEVGPGDYADLNIAVAYLGGYMGSQEITSLVAYLTVLPEFGDIKTSLVEYSQLLSYGDIITLQYWVQIDEDAVPGDHPANIEFYYYENDINVTNVYREDYDFTFSLSGKPKLDASLSTSEVPPGDQELLLTIHNEGSATASSITLELTSPSAFIEDSEITLENLDPASRVEIPVELRIPKNYELTTITLTANLEYRGPLGWSYGDEENLQLFVTEPLKPLLSVEVETPEVIYPEQITATMKVINRGDGAAKDIHLELIEGYGVSINHTLIDIDELEGLGEAEIPLEINLQTNQQQSSATITISGSYSDPNGWTYTITKTETILVDQPPKPRIDASLSETKLMGGSEGELELTIFNNGPSIYDVSVEITTQNPLTTPGTTVTAYSPILQEENDWSVSFEYSAEPVNTRTLASVALTLEYSDEYGYSYVESMALVLPIDKTPEPRIEMYGTVVDEQGMPLYDVEVTLYHSSGDHVATEYTDEAGYFHFIELEEGGFTIHFEKDGYVTFVKSISTPSSWGSIWDLDVGEIRLQKALRLSTSVLSRVVSPGNTVLFPFTVSNIGDEPEEVEFSIVHPADWTTKVLDQNGEIRNVLLDSGSLNLNLEVVVPSTAIGNTTVSLTAVGHMLSTLSFKIFLGEVTNDVEVISTFTEITAEAGEAINYPLTIWNQEQSDRLVVLKVLSAPENWQTVFTSADVEISNILITAGESLSLNFEVTPPSSVETGNYSTVISAESDDGDILEQIALKTKVVGSYQLNLELSTLYTTVTIGDATTLFATVSNIGQSPITTLYLEATPPTDWEVSITPVQVASLAPKASSTFTIVTDTPTNAEAVDYLIPLTAVSDQVESNEEELRVTAQASTYWGFIGIGIMAIFIISLIVVFTRFKRR